MKPTTLMVSTLVAGAIAGAAPQIPTFVKGAFAPGAIATVGAADQRGSSAVQIGWPTSPKPLVLRPEGKGYVAYLPLHNTTQQRQCVWIDAHVQSSEGTDSEVHITPEQPFPIDPSAALIKRVDVALKSSNPKCVSGPATGFLRIYAADVPASGDANICKVSGMAKFSVQEIRIPEQPMMAWIFVGTLSTTVVVVLSTMFSLLLRNVRLFHVMGSVNWSFERSWGANVTLGGALLMTLLGLTMFPDRPHLMTKVSYSLLQVLFGALVSLAPLVYNLIRREVQVNIGGIPRVEVQGYVIMFLIAGGLVLWAALGQVATLSIVTEEFISSGTLEWTAGRALQGLAILLFLLLLVYGFRSLYLTAKTVSATPAAIGGAMPGPQPAAAVAGLPGPMTEWSVL
jgi:hypothetical protein